MRILFVCTGNTCRSPMAEGLLRKLARERGLDVEVRSAGVAAIKGASMSMHAEAVLKERGITDAFESTPLHAELAEWADLILTLTQGHKRQVVYTFPHAADKIYTLKEFVEDDEKLLADREELQRLIADRELGKALGQGWTDAEERRLNELQQRMPVYDISDPFGGSRADYDRTAAEIGAALEKLADKLQRGELEK
ncbi:MAG: low molecular weight protein arginine phosphatase [Paenibacillus macerans]|uniref:Low molecular weight protein arginine phosphatase n=1 Tax=Paenibacillus macerans TaxID=44252 RepID=A0A6N8F4G2_PAEMA|nr:low molecular weight protein arginine phosphatase [Paenibacillus macerans]MDU7472927.1 low molecular weight protein arginine phosphatase [Paenibacillus macerans]MUG25703.1 low molecular weight protein arginine phosphatase [Paenibacillus macerans]GBK65005.1 low molecular weight protein arginine phosphatase [Paenibacillus macerans]GBK71298.1 low molecular weight protein arginine phosphatase [Paenibacillus macerans]